MRIFGYDLLVKKAATVPLPPLSPSGRDGWWPMVVREPFTGAWQLNQEIRPQSVLANPTVFACVTRIAQDIAKCGVDLVEQTSPGVWTATTNPAYTPVLRTPNHYQTTQKFIEQWVVSKLIWGNTYVLKGRDQRGVVNRLYVLNPSYVTVLIAPDGSVYYQLRKDELVGLGTATAPIDVTLPASEIIHDRMVCLFHPLVGISPLYAAALPAHQGLTILNASTQFFANGSNPGGLLIAPTAITAEQQQRLKTEFEQRFSGENQGRLAVLGNNLKYEPLGIPAGEAQLIEQLNKTEEEICAAFGLPMFLLNATNGAPYANNELILQLYYAGALQSSMTNLEATLGAGLSLPVTLGIQLDIDDLIWMDTATRTKAASDAVGSGTMTPNEARLKYFGLGPVVGGDTPYLQQQYYSLRALAARDAADPFAPPALPPPGPDGTTPTVN
jgi:HK97 family phage portal protein